MNQQKTIVWTTIFHAKSMVALVAASYPVPLLDDMISMQFSLERKEVEQ